MIRAAFFDLDGTLVNSAGVISEAVKAELIRIRGLGVAVALATGRPNFGAVKIIEELAITAPSMFFSGALVIEPKSSEIIFEAAIPKDKLLSLIGFARNYEFSLELYSSRAFYVEKETEYSRIHSREYLKVDPLIRNFEEVIGTASILKAVIMDQVGADHSKIFATAEELGLVIGSGHGAAHPNLVFRNITSKDAKREVGFQKMLAALNLSPNEVIACGDGESDIPFIKLAGIGVAMGNASLKCKQAADFITDSVEQNGVITALQKFVPQR